MMPVQNEFQVMKDVSTLLPSLTVYNINSPGGCFTVHLPHEIILNTNLMQQGNFINVFLARHVSGTYAHHQEPQMLSCPVCGADGAVHGNIRTMPRRGRYNAIVMNLTAT